MAAMEVRVRVSGVYVNVSEQEEYKTIIGLGRISSGKGPEIYFCVQVGPGMNSKWIHKLMSQCMVQCRMYT